MPGPNVPASVVVVTHNEGALLRNTVDSVAPTLPEGSEIIVVDDDSTDGSTDFLAGGYGCARAVKPDTRLGAPAARSYGAREAVGEYIVFSDAHVEVADGWLGQLVEALEEPGVGLVAPAISSLNNRSVPRLRPHVEGPFARVALARAGGNRRSSLRGASPVGVLRGIPTRHAVGDGRLRPRLRDLG